MTYHSDTLAFKKSEILGVIQSICPNFEIEECKPTVNSKTIETTTLVNIENMNGFNDFRKFLYKMPSLTMHEMASILSEIDPALVRDMTEYDANQQYPSWYNALNLISRSIEAKLLDFNNGKSSKKEFLKFINSQDILIEGFNIPSVQQSSNRTCLNVQDVDVENHKINTLQAELTKAKAQILELENELKNSQQLNSIYIVEEATPEEAVPHTRARNNVSKIIAILSSMAELNIDEPFKAYEAMQSYADSEKLAIPGKDTVGSWLKLAKS